MNLEIEQARETLAEIEETTWGVTLGKSDRERFAVLPAGTLDYPPRGRAACREAIERVMDLYNRVGTAVDRSLGEVVRAVRAGASSGRPSESRPWSSGSKSVGGKSSTSPGRSRCLTADYKTLAATLRVRWR